MDRILVVVFDTESQAHAGKEALLHLDNEGTVVIYDYAVVAKDSDGGLSVRESSDMGPVGTLVGTSLGGFIGAIGGPVGLLVGAALAKPFFGSFSLDLGNLGFLVPALVFATANGVAEELAYRGALMNWTARVTGTWTALIAQAVVFGLAHGGPDVGGSPIVLMAALGLGGFIAGWIALRTRSLLLPMAWHIALDLPLYAYLACRAS